LIDLADHEIYDQPTKFVKNRIMIHTTLPPHAPPNESTRGGVYHPTLQEIQKDSISLLAQEYWLAKDPTAREWDPNIVEEIYFKELERNRFETKKLMLLEFSQYLEKYLWPNFNGEKASLAHVLSIVLMVNEKFRERVSVWDCFVNMPDQFSSFFIRVLRLTISPLSDTLTLQVRRFLLVFLIHAFQSLENQLLRTECMILVSLVTWHCFGSSSLREQEFASDKDLKKRWNAFAKRFKKADNAQKELLIFQRTWISNLMKGFVKILYSIPESGDADDDAIAYCERFLEFLIDLEAQLPTRRYFNTLLEDHQILILCKLAPLLKRKEESELFKQLLEILKFYAGFEIHDHTGLALTDDQMTELHFVKTQFYSGDTPLALPKLNLQFLTIHDYLLRNFNLFRLESTYEIRQDIEDVVKRLAPRIIYPSGRTEFTGWARMAIEIEQFSIVEVSKPNLGESKPSQVKADVTFNLGRYTDSIQNEWDSLRQHD
ncbi:5479_t:CDS:10, partial [Scutellospora calospora]